MTKKTKLDLEQELHLQRVEFKETLQGVKLDLIDGTQNINAQFFDIIEKYSIENIDDKKSMLFRLDFANTMANIGKMISDNYTPSNFLEPITPVSIEYSNKQILSSFQDSSFIENGIKYSFDKIIWDKIYNHDKSMTYDY